jgi:rod shape-determining protein MreC
MANAWKIARKGNAQLPLVIVIALAVVLVLLGKAQGGLFDRARGHATDLLAPVLEKVRAPVAGFDRWMGSITEIFSVYQENLRLKDENARLRQWRNVAVVLQGRVGRYQQLLHAVPDPRMNAVLAKVIGRANRPFLQTMILDAGRDNHALPGEAVMDPRGMIGRIYLTGNRTSWVILLTDLNSRIPVTISPGNVQAIMAGDNSPMPALDMVSHTVTLHAGDQVTSSGDGGFLPAGLPVGTLVSDGSGRFRVALLSDPGASQDVEILNFSKPPETPPANAELPVEAAGLKPEAPPPAPAAAAKPQTQPQTQPQIQPQQPGQAKTAPLRPGAAPQPETAATQAQGETEGADR